MSETTNAALSSRPEATVDVIPIVDAKKLVNYAAEHSTKFDDTDILIGNLTDAINEFEHVSKSAKNDHRISEAIKNLAVSYQKLCIATAPVTGRTVRESEEPYKALRGIVLLSFIFFSLGILAEIINLMADTFAEIESPFFKWILALHNNKVLTYLNPLVWGALGSCVYSMKLYYDLVRKWEFERQVMRGAGLRIFLGGVFGALVVNVLGIHELGLANGPTLPSIAIAFLCGLGVDPVFNTFILFVNVLAERIKGDGIAMEPQKRSDVHETIKESHKRSEV